jgi:N-acetylneuraminate synthase
VDGVRLIETALQNPVDKSDNTAFQPLKQMFEKSLAVNKSLPAGHILTFDDLEAKKPAGQGIPAARFKEVIGQKLAADLQTWQFLKEELLADK